MSNTNTIETKAKLIISACMEEKSTSPLKIFHNIVKRDFVSIHGPEHHILDGACILTAYHNAGGKLQLEAALNTIMTEGLKMPGAICGLWGVCGAVLSVGCALAIIDGTGPLSDDGSWGKHMEYTARAVGEIGKTYGPRCCKRDGMLAILAGIDYINENTEYTLERDGAICYYSDRNSQCIREKCPWFGTQERSEHKAAYE